MTAHLNCRVCAEPLPPPFLDLGFQPAANALELTAEASVTAPRYPLALTRCPSCTLLQLTEVVDPALLFRDYLYATGVSASFHRHFGGYAQAAAHRLGRLNGGGQDLVVDIGSNDGLLLGKFRELGFRVLGVEPAQRLAGLAKAEGLDTICHFWTEDLAKGIKLVQGQASVICANNVFAHLDDVKGFLRGVKALLRPGGLFVGEVVSAQMMLQSGTFDLNYHEHLTQYTARALMTLLDGMGFEVLAIEDVASHGGSLRWWATPKTSDKPIPEELLRRFADEEVLAGEGACQGLARFAGEFKQAVHHLLCGQLKSIRIFGYGAPAKATVLANYLKLNSGVMYCIVDDNPAKQGKFLPGTDIPIYAPEALRSAALRPGPDGVAFIFPWNLTAELLQKIRLLGVKRAVIPLPQLKVVDL